MNSESQATDTAASKIAQYLPILEKLLWAILVLSVVIAYMGINDMIYKVVLLIQAVIFFLMAYVPPEIPAPSEGQQYGMSDLLAVTVIPKVLWISLSICATGIAFYFFDFKGYKNLLLIGTTAGGVAALLLLIFFVNGVRNIKLAIPVLLRCLPILFIGIYLLLNSWHSNS